MARQEIITDDLTGEAGAEALTIAIGDRNWTIDLASSSRAKLEKTLAPFLAKATAVGGSGKRKSSSPKATKATKGGGLDPAERARVREWAAANDVAMPARGRIPGAVIEQYRASRRRSR